MKKECLEIFNRFSGKTLIKLPLRATAKKISYITHPNNEKKTKLDERPLSLAEILRMPSPLLTKFLSSLTNKELEALGIVISKAYKSKKLNENCYLRFISCKKRVLAA